MQNMTLEWKEENSLILDYKNNLFQNSYIFKIKLMI